MWVLVGVFVGWLCYEFITFPSISRLRTENPATTSLMETRIKEAEARGETQKRYQIWVPLDKISPNLQRAVLAGEDTNFATHHGFDYAAIQRAWEEAQRESEKEAKQEGDDQSSWIPAMPDFKRGASTITQQLAKNLYLSSQRSFVRKGREAVITYFLERELTKPRILEIYLNVIEWGDGIYGAEAASQYYFKKPASQLSVREAAYLSAMIPGPLKIFNPQLNPRRVARRQRVILRGMPHVQMPQGTG
jgi:monofunctional biosynthetic peptidoglycan transglycosylase